MYSKDSNQFVYPNSLISFSFPPEETKDPDRAGNFFQNGRVPYNAYSSLHDSARPTSNCHRIFLNQKSDQIYLVSFYCSFHAVKCRNNTVSHFSYAPLVQCRITRKRNVIFLFWDHQRKAQLYLHQPLKFLCDQIRNEWENISLSALPSKHHFTLHYHKRNSDHIALFSGSNFCYARDKSRFILGNI